MDWIQILTIVFGVIAVIFGIKWRNAKALLREGAEALKAISDAIEDDQLTKAEIAGILQECSDVVLAFKKLIGR